VRIEACCNIRNILCGAKGVARVFGPQKGATAEDVEVLSASLDNLARVAEPVLHRNISQEPGSGASGGLGAGLLLIGATLRPRAEAINEHFGLQRIMDQKWNVIITAEGSIDWQSTRGKMTAEIARMAKAQGAQVIALAGTIGPGAEMCYESGIKAYASILSAPITLDEAIGSARELLIASAERAMRMIMIGMLLSKSL
jgi:glycerate kinase